MTWDGNCFSPLFLMNFSANVMALCPNVTWDYKVIFSRIAERSLRHWLARHCSAQVINSMTSLKKTSTTNSHTARVYRRLTCRSLSEIRGQKAAMGSLPACTGCTKATYSDSRANTEWDSRAKKDVQQTETVGLASKHSKKAHIESTWFNTVKYIRSHYRYRFWHVLID